MFGAAEAARRWARREQAKDRAKGYAIGYAEGLALGRKERRVAILRLWIEYLQPLAERRANGQLLVAELENIADELDAELIAWRDAEAARCQPWYARLWRRIRKTSVM